MNGLDIFVIVVFLFFALRGLLVGLIKEVLSIVGLIAAVIISLKFNHLMGFYLKGINDPLILKVLSVLILFFLVIALTQLVILLIRKVIKPTIIGAVDKVLGLILGLFEGLVVIGTLLYFGSRFDFAREWINQSRYAYRISNLYERVVISNFTEIKEFFESLKD